MRSLIGAAALVVLAACQPTGFGITATPPPEVKQPPIPSPFRGEEQPVLERTDKQGLFSAPELAPNVYFYEAEDLWYRYAYRRWYQAFRWNGSWFILEEPPEILADHKLEKRELPTIPEYEDGPR